MRRNEKSPGSVIAALLVAATWGTQAQQPAPTPEPEWVQTDGRTHPELVPESALWRSAFLDLARIAAKPDVEVRRQSIEGLRRESLHVSAADMSTILEVAAAVDTRIEEALRPVREGRPGPDGSYRACHDQARGIVMEGRDELATRLSPVAMKKIRRWLAKEVAPTGTFGVWKHELPTPAPIQ